MSGKEREKMKNYKIILYACLLASIVIVLGACTVREGSISGGKIGSNSEEIEGKYSKFTGTYYREVDFKKGTKLEMIFKTDTRKGTTIGRLETEKGKVLAVLDEEHKHAQLEIPKTATYRVYVYAKEHGGSVNLKWKTIK